MCKYLKILKLIFEKLVVRHFHTKLVKDGDNWKNWQRCENEIDISQIIDNLDDARMRSTLINENLKVQLLSEHDL